MKKRKNDIGQVNHVEQLVGSFYEQAMEDEHIGSFFTEAIPLDLEDHLPRIIRFWTSILLDTNDYRGNPMIKHIMLHQKMSISESHMNRWLSLWKATVDKSHEGPVADLAKSRAEQIGLLMLRKIK